MKLICLNIWGGHVEGPLLEFIQKYFEVGFFCLQEVYFNAPHKISREDRFVSLDILNKINHLLPDHRAFFRPVVDGIYGLATVIHKDINVLDEGSLWIYENPDYIGYGPAQPRILQWIKCRLSQKDSVKDFFVVNIHGLWNGQGKTDTAPRIAQSEKIKDFLSNLALPFVLVGDFNLRPDTQSLKIIKNSVKNLKDWIEISGIQSTRSSYYPKEEKFADYIFTSPEIHVNQFEVLSGVEDQVSDHLPLFLDFEV